MPQEFDFQFRLADVLDGEQKFTVQAPGGEETEPVLDDEGDTLGRVVRLRPR